MPFSLADVLYGGLVPAVLAAGLWRLLPVLSSREWLRPVATAISLIAGVHAGYWLLGLGKLLPVSHWEWLPWTLLLSLPVTVAASKGMDGRALSFALLLGAACVASWLLVPDWEHLEPSRSVYLIALIVGVVGICVGLGPLTRQMAAAKLLMLLTAVLTCEAVILALSGSLRFAQIAGCGAAALAGMSLAAFFDRTNRTAEGIALPFALLAAGMMLIGGVNSFSDVPLISYVLPPLAPLSLWPAATRPWARSSGPRRWLVLSLPILICLVAVGLAAMA